ncbi:RDD family protein [Granulosicoccaceae sp. 1_MG-2023]|nr:RDD family protein [Granulosicoccaceae sp. 1_MG-2023]
MTKTTLTFRARLALLIKHLLAALYDLLLLFSVLFVVTGLVVLLNGGERVGAWLVAPLALLVAGYFYVFFWIKGGQTLGMRAWHIAYFGADGGLPSGRAALLRFAVMVLTLGAGSLWILFDPQGRTLQDKLSGLYCRVIPKR